MITANLWPSGSTANDCTVSRIRPYDRITSFCVHDLYLSLRKYPMEYSSPACKRFQSCSSHPNEKWRHLRGFLAEWSLQSILGWVYHHSSWCIVEHAPPNNHRAFANRTYIGSHWIESRANDEFHWSFCRDEKLLSNEFLPIGFLWFRQQLNVPQRCHPLLSKRLIDDRWVTIENLLRMEQKMVCCWPVERSRMEFDFERSDRQETIEFTFVVYT